ncbi:MAG: cytochrome c, partial [Pseudomonadales bacterium]|nr:cytochrome c [Pseudomonadales bacterium]
FDYFALHADAIADLAEVVPHCFPEGSGEGKTEALPVIWEEPEAFKQTMDDFVSAARGISEAAATGEMSEIGPAIDKLGQACKGCHDDYREEHDH